MRDHPSGCYSDRVSPPKPEPVGKHAVKERRALPGPKRFLVPAVVGVVTFGAVTAFAATLTVNSKSLAAGSAGVSTCNANAAVTYNTAYSASLIGYQVTTAPVTTAAGCANLSYKV